jgi:hypothetical protein
MRINTLRINNKNKHYILPDSKISAMCHLTWGRIFKLVLNFYCRSNVRTAFLIWDTINKAKKRHFEERTHYRSFRRYWERNSIAFC